MYLYTIPMSISVFHYMYISQYMYITITVPPRIPYLLFTQINNLDITTIPSLKSMYLRCAGFSVCCLWGFVGFFICLFLFWFFFVFKEPGFPAWSYMAHVLHSTITLLAPFFLKYCLKAFILITCKLWKEKYCTGHWMQDNKISCNVYFLTHTRFNA